MSRKDTILIAVLLNAGLLAILFITAVIYDTELPLEQVELNLGLADAKEEMPQTVKEVSAPSMVALNTSDEVDSALKFYEAPEAEPVSVEEAGLATAAAVTPVTLAESVEITVKKGDSLDKIAKANGTSVAAIKKVNGLQSEKLSIGQTLKIPLGKKKAAPAVSNQVVEAEHYVIKAGDNPWKLSKQFNVKYEDILRLNNLDEEKAKNLKAGDRIRIK